ncbi:hypothetical protein GCM10009860_24720 [Microbacterium mitrae]|uniref:Helix-turn-helix domain-containing protein n=1 Tax=Microbacterium mitrae TaxID=664640 RepID=A0A5C8HKE0_9MICO|nr:helix-turn-helix domain-containing protein [Microbacterium mitrae]TXK03068.1 helix-turn-helix domain-containing protein [Microbacterium mitrae]
MNTTLLPATHASTQRLLLDERVREDARAVHACAHDRKLRGLKVELDDGSEFPLPAELTKALLFTINSLTQGNLTLQAMPEQLTTSTAAGILGISRPTLMKLISSNELPAAKVGSHHRLNLHDVLALRDKRAAVRKIAFDELRDLEDKLDFE